MDMKGGPVHEGDHVYNCGSFHLKWLSLLKPFNTLSTKHSLYSLRQAGLVRTFSLITQVSLSLRSSVDQN
jgi:hypothetical protein